MASDLYIPPCVHTPAHPFHPPPIDKPLRIQIHSPAAPVDRLFPGIGWRLDDLIGGCPQPAGIPLAKLAYRKIYGRDPGSAEDLKVREELTWPKTHARIGNVDYYAVTFDHLIPPQDTDPEVLMINIIDVVEEGESVVNLLLFSVDPAEYVGKKELAVPRCCQKRKGTTDRLRVNTEVSRREGREE